MKTKIHEQLSALVDDELPDAEQALLLRQLAADDDLQQVLARYQLVSDSLHDSLPQQVDPGFHRRVYDALEAERTMHAVPRSASRWYRLLGGAAIAASVAVVAVVSLQNTRQESPVDGQTLAIAPAAGSFIRPENVANVADVTTRVEPAASTRDLDVYLVNHNEYSVNGGMQGMLPYVRIVGQDPQAGNGSLNNE
jgi:sigma-E factor negative regulatory protein RseA